MPSCLLAKVEDGFRAAFADDWNDQMRQGRRRSFYWNSDLRDAYPKVRSPSLEDQWPHEPVSAAQVIIH
jgi:hypothetical protein